MKGATFAQPRGFSCLIWNVQNLTSRKRKGMFGRVPERMVYVQKTMRKADVDLTIILETGLDAEIVVQPTLEEFYDCSVHKTTNEGESPEYMPETYFLAFRESSKNKYSILSSESLHSRIKNIHDADKPYRGGVVVAIGNNEGNAICILAAIHAPSPSHKRECRIDVIVDFLKQAEDWASKYGKPLILCGDLNIRQREWRYLYDILQLKYRHLLDPAMATSFKKFTTSNLEKEDSGSESYDQVWSSVNYGERCVSARIIDVEIDSDLFEKAIAMNQKIFNDVLDYLISVLSGQSSVSQRTIDLTEAFLKTSSIHLEICRLTKEIQKYSVTHSIMNLYTPEQKVILKEIATNLKRYLSIDGNGWILGRLNNNHEQMMRLQKTVEFCHTLFMAGGPNTTTVRDLTATGVSDHRPVKINVINN